MKTKTTFTKKSDVIKQWHLIDAKDQNLGRICTKIAVLLIGKHKVSYTPSLDCGDFVIVVNAELVQVASQKLKGKIYSSHSGYPGGYKEKSLETMLKEHPERVIQLAVKRMLPQNRLGKALLKKLKIYKGPEHDHIAQKPVLITL